MAEHRVRVYAWDREGATTREGTFSVRGAAQLATREARHSVYLAAEQKARAAGVLADSAGHAFQVIA